MSVDAKFLQECFSYNHASGVIFWKVRPLHHFNGSEDGEINKRLWHAWNTRYADRPSFYRMDAGGYYMLAVSHNKKRFYPKMHRVVWLLNTGKMPINEIDHINGDRTDNRIENLRDVNRSVNARNSALRKDNSSGFVGVTLHTCGQWLAKAQADKKTYIFGYFPTKEEAVTASIEGRRLLGFSHRHGGVND